MTSKKDKIPGKIERYSAQYWAKEITSGLDRYKKTFDQARESIDVFSGKKKLEDVERRLSCWWYLIESLMPAYFSSTPKVEVGLRKKAGDSIYQIVATGLERSTQYCLDECFDFASIGLISARQFLLTGSASLWARYDAEIEDKVREFEVREGSDSWLDLSGSPIEVEEVTEKDGKLYGIQVSKAKGNESAVLDLVHYSDYLESSARQESEVTWKAKRAWLTKDEVEEVFGSDMVKKLNFDSYPEELRSSEKWKDRNIFEGKAELWEIHCEESGKVYWVQAKGDKSILESGEPELKFSDFYPCQTIKATLDPDSVIPVSDWVHAKDLVLEVERLTSRIHAATLAIRANAAYDASLGDAIEGLLKGDLKMLPVKSWPAYKARGGLQAGMEFLNISPYVSALESLVSAREMALQKLYEVMKCTELTRGTSDPRKTATANRLENQWSSLQLVVRQNQFADFIGKAIGKVGAIVAQQFSEQKLLETGDVESLIATSLPVDLDPMQKMQTIEEAKRQYFDICRNNAERVCKIEIASDSMVAINEKQDREDMVTMMESCGGFFDQMKAQVEAYPPLIGWAMEVMRKVMRGYRGGKELEPAFMTALEQVQQIAMVKQKQAMQQPPDPKSQEIQGRLQIAQMESQSKIELANIEGQIRMADAQANMQIENLKAQIEKMRAETESWRVQQEVVARQRELEIKGNAVQVDMLKVQAETQVDMANLNIIAENNRLKGLLDVMTQDLERTKLEVGTMLEKYKILDGEMSRVKEGAISKPKDGPSAPSIPPITVNIDARKASKRRATHLPDGSIELSDIEDDAAPTDLDPGRPKA